MANKLDYNPLKENDELMDEILQHWEEYEAEYKDRTEYIHQIIRGLISLNHQSDFALDFAMYDEELINEIDGGEMLAQFKKNQETIKQIHKLLWENISNDELTQTMCNEEYNMIATE